MATSLGEIMQFIQNIGWKARIPDGEEFIAIGFTTESYRDSDGDNYLQVIISANENGEFLKVFSPMVYKYKDGPYKMQLFQTCLMVSGKTKMLQYEYDEEDGEIRAIIEFPLEDSKLTEKQLARVVNGLVQLVDHFDETFRQVMDKGEIKFPIRDKQDCEIASILGQLSGLSREELAGLIEEVKRRRSGSGSTPPDSL